MPALENYSSKLDTNQILFKMKTKYAFCIRKRWRAEANMTGMMFAALSWYFCLLTYHLLMCLMSSTIYALRRCSVRLYYRFSWVTFLFVIIQLSPMLECDPTVCLPEKSKVVRGWLNFSRGDKQSGHTPTRVITGILYRIFLHQTSSNRIPAALRKYSI